MSVHDNYEITFRDCKYNSSMGSQFVGYCKHPKYDTPTFHPFIKCKESICEDFELNGGVE